jgi:hypothetical protein
MESLQLLFAGIGDPINQWADRVAFGGGIYGDDGRSNDCVVRNVRPGLLRLRGLGQRKRGRQLRRASG